MAASLAHLQRLQTPRGGRLLRHSCALAAAPRSRLQHNRSHVPLPQSGLLERRPGPVRRPALQSWAEYRVGASAAADAPLAVLFGWLGCRSDYLRKYAVVYNSLGVDTLAVNPSVPFTIFPTLADRATDDLLGMTRALLVDPPAPNRPIILHCFSTGGWLLLGQVLRRAQVRETTDGPGKDLASAAASIVGSARALVVDCAPGPVDAETAARALDAIARNASAADNVSPVSAAARRVIEPVMRWHLRRPSVKKRVAETKSAWIQGGPSCPTLLMYSETDVLVPAEDVQAFADIRRNKDSRVSLRAFPDSPHVELLRRYPEDYTETLKTFLSGHELLRP